MVHTTLWGGIEAGGTKMNCAIATAMSRSSGKSSGSPSGPALPQILAETRIATTTPTETIAQIVHFFQVHQQQLGPLETIGLASFGPVDLNLSSPTYGHVLDTPKPGWRHIDLLGDLGRSLQLPIFLDTDVNAAALGEHRWGAAQGLDTFIYLTVGTGIGGGALVNGKLLHGLLHPEMGHILLRQDVSQDPFPGGCPFHGNCLEGLASGSAIAARWGKPADQLPPEHPAWALEAEYLAQAIATFTFTLSPERIILGGGIMHQQHLFPLIHRLARAKLETYLAVPQVLEQIDRYIVPPLLGDQAGILGAIALAQEGAGA